MMTVTHVDAGKVAALLALPGLAEQTAWLRHAGLLDASGLRQLLDVAAHEARGDPGSAGRLAALCAAIAPGVGFPLAVPRATYILAQVHASKAELAAALRLIDVAHSDYIALGAEADALRTFVGRMSVLIDLGRYAEALADGEHVLTVVAQRRKQRHMPFADDLRVLPALVYQNRGVCFEHIGRYDDALAAYDAAQAAFAALAMPEQSAEVRNNHGIVLLALGRAAEALHAFQAAATMFAAAGLTLLHAQALINVGNAQIQLGNYTDCLQAFEQARNLLAQVAAPAESYVLLLDTADAYLALNLFREALGAYEEAERAFKSAGMVFHRGRALYGAGAAALGEGRLAEAEAALAEAETLFAAAEHVPFRSSVMLERSAVASERGDSRAALALARTALALVDAADWPTHQAYALLHLAMLAPTAEEVEAYLDRAALLAERVMLPDIRYRLLQRQGHLRLAQGRDDEAQALLEQAISITERVRGRLSHEALRSSFMIDKVAAYNDLVDLQLGRDDASNTWQAFVVAERAKSRALADQLAGIGRFVRDEHDSPQLRAYRACEAELHAIYNDLLAQTEQQSGARVVALQARAAELEQRIGRYRLECSSELVDPIAAPAPQPILESLIAGDEALVVFHALGPDLVSFVGQHGQLRVFRNRGGIARVDGLLRRLQTHWERFRAGPAFALEHAETLERSARRLLGELYRELLAPVVAELSAGDRPGQRVTIVPHGTLHQVPFHALFDGERYVVERFEIVYAPSATVAALCAERRGGQLGRTLVLGRADDALPAINDELAALAQILPDAMFRTDQHASIAVVEAEAPRCDILHIACHGVYRADNPMFSALKLFDGWLTAARVLELRLPGSTVMLSACESGRAGVLPGDEILGLTRAFLAAGASATLVSLWLVQDQSTALLMEHLYRELGRGASRAAALRAAQRAVKDRYPHPFFWAPFIVVGQR